MVAPEPSTQIEHAARLLKAGNRAEAYRLLKSVARQAPGDWRAWWGLAHATTDEMERIAALKKTVELNPHHPKAAGLLQKAQAQQAGRLVAPTAAPQPSVPVSPFEAQTFPEADALEEDPGVQGNPFVGYEIIPSRQNTWEGPVSAGQTSAGAPAKKKNAAPSEGRASSGSAMDRWINIAIAVLAVLVVVGLIAVILPRLNFTSLIPSGPPNNFSAPDEEFRTTGGGTATVNGPAIRDRIDGLFEAHNWVFDAAEGQTVTIDVEAIGETDPRLRLLDPDGSLLAEDDDSGYDYGMGVWDATLRYTVSRAGTYTMRIDVFTGGDFTIRVYD